MKIMSSVDSDNKSIILSKYFNVDDNKINSCEVHMKVVSKPYYGLSNVSFIREEKNGFWILVPKQHPEIRELIINKTSKQILDLCNGHRTLYEIESEMKKLYPMVDSKKLEDDVKNTIAHYTQLTIIEWSGENPFLILLARVLDKNYRVKIGQISDVSKIHDFIMNTCNKYNEKLESEVLFYINPCVSREEYDEVNIHQKSFLKTEKYILLTIDNNICGVIGIAIPKLMSKAAIITIIITPETIAKMLLSYVMENLLIILNTDITKISVHDTNEKLINIKLYKIFTKCGFYNEASLKNELGFDVNLNIMSCMCAKHLDLGNSE
jgi:hypothetical protein